MRNNLVRLGAAAAVAAAGLGISAAPSQAADLTRAATVVSHQVVAVDDVPDDQEADDDTGNWGLLGLLGAAGLAGLLKARQAVRSHRDANGATRATSNH